jgi:hypothetical protein
MKRTSIFRKGIFALFFMIAFAVSICSVANLNVASAQTLVPTARQPVTIIPLAGRIHVLSNRVDANFNGTQDAGDSAAAWSVYDAATLQQVGFFRFPWESVNAQRPAVDTAARTLYIARGGRISSFNMTTQQLLRDTVAPFSASAVTYVPALQTLLLSRRPDFTNPGVVLAFVIPLGSTVASYSAGPNVQQTIGFTTARGESGVAILSEGNFGRPNSTVSIVTLNALTGQALTSTAANVGDTGNHLFQRGDSIFVTSNGSHQVHILDLNTKAIVRTIPTGTTGSNGPRESVADGDMLYVTTFTSDVRRFRISTGAPVSPLLMPQGKPEGLALVGGRLVVANAFLPNSFTSASSIAVFDLRTVSVREQNNVLAAQVSVVPNPATNEAQCRIRAENPSDLARAPFRLVTPLGAVAFDVDEQFVERVDAATVNVHIPIASWNLASGMYTLQIQTARGMRAILFVVQR